MPDAINFDLAIVAQLAAELTRLADTVEHIAASLALIAQHLTTPTPQPWEAAELDGEPFHIDDLVVDKPSGEQGRVAAVRSGEIKVRWANSILANAKANDLSWWPVADFEKAR